MLSSDLKSNKSLNIEEDQQKLRLDQSAARMQNIHNEVRMMQNSPGTRLIKGSEHWRECRFKGETFRTEISQFDDLFEIKGIFSGEITELIGLAGSGKTMILNTIMINILERSKDIHIFFIDTKNDFQSLKLVNMMTQRGIPQAKQFEILKQIHVERAPAPDDLIKALKFIFGTAAHDKVKIIMIDSITVPFYFYAGHMLMNLASMTQVIDLLKLRAKTNNCAVSFLPMKSFQQSLTLHCPSRFSLQILLHIITPWQTPLQVKKQLEVLTLGPAAKLQTKKRGRD